MLHLTGYNVGIEGFRQLSIFAATLIAVGIAAHLAASKLGKFTGAFQRTIPAVFSQVENVDLATSNNSSSTCLTYGLTIPARDIENRVPKRTVTPSLLQFNPYYRVC